MLQMKIQTCDTLSKEVYLFGKLKARRLLSSIVKNKKFKAF